jgi:ATP-dependent Lon protease
MPDKNVSSSHSPEEAGTYPVLPLRDIVVFPHMIVPLFVGREKSIRALEEVMGSDKQIMLATQINASDDDPEPSGIYDIGTIANVLQLLKLPDGTVKVLVEGRARAEIVEYTDREEYYEARAVELAEPEEDPVEIEALSRSVVSEFENYVKLNKKISQEVVGAASQIDDYSKLADTVASHLSSRFRKAGHAFHRFGQGTAREGRSASWKARSRFCRWKSASAPASSGRWRRPSASTISTSR